MKRCPRCGREGSGPFSRWVLNSRKVRYDGYLYFAHSEKGVVKWCYVGKEGAARVRSLSNKTEDL